MSTTYKIGIFSKIIYSFCYNPFMSKRIVFLGVLVLLFSVGVFFKINSKPSTPDVFLNDEDKPQTPKTSEEVTVSPDWLQYRSDELGISFSYPSEMDLYEDEDKTVRLLLVGPSQAYATEMFDGIVLIFSKGVYESKTLEDHVEKISVSKREDLIYESVTDIERKSVGKYTGYGFEEVSLGRYVNIYLPMEENMFLNISYFLEDPEGQGFEDILEEIFKSLSM